MDKLKIIFLSVVLFLLGCFLLLKTDAPSWISWSCVIFFGGCACFLIGTYLYEFIYRRKVGVNNAPVFELKDGRDYEICYSDLKISVMANGSVISEMDWKDVHEIYMAAIDTNNIKRVSWLLHNEQKEVIEIPWNAKGADALPIELEKKGDLFSQAADYKIKEYFQGFKIVWKKT